MRENNAGELLAIATDLELELGQMKRLEQDIFDVQQEIQRNPEHTKLFYEVLALKRKYPCCSYSPLRRNL
jgi:hypothetical protein